MPPLRERGTDILLLARHFVCTFAARHSRAVGDLHPDLIRLLGRYPWPGNIRQLAHAMEAAVLHARGPSLRAADIPARILQQPVSDTPGPRYSFYGTETEERVRIAAALRAQRGNITRAARALGMARNTLRSRLASLGIDPAEPDRLPAPAPAPSIVPSGHAAGGAGRPAGPTHGSEQT
jgi:DNA-binding NtrC family response regulator